MFENEAGNPNAFALLIRFITYGISLNRSFILGHLKNQRRKSGRFGDWQISRDLQLAWARLSGTICRVGNLFTCTGKTAYQPKAKKFYHYRACFRW